MLSFATHRSNESGKVILPFLSNPKVTVVPGANLKFTELEIKQLAQLIMDKFGCARARAYERVHECTTVKVFRYNKVTDTYAKS